MLARFLPPYILFQVSAEGCRRAIEAHPGFAVGVKIRLTADIANGGAFPHYASRLDLTFASLFLQANRSCRPLKSRSAWQKSAAAR